MNRITLVDYIGYCDSKGEVTGHTAKTLKETKEMLSDSYDVSMVDEIDYRKVGNRLLMIQLVLTLISIPLFLRGLSYVQNYGMSVMRNIIAMDL